MQNQLASEQKELSQSACYANARVLDQYKAQIIQAIQQQWLVPDNANKDLSCVLLIHLAPDGGGPECGGGANQWRCGFSIDQPKMPYSGLSIAGS